MLKLEDLPEYIQLHSYVRRGEYTIERRSYAYRIAERWYDHVTHGDVPTQCSFIYIPDPDTGDWVCVVDTHDGLTIKLYPDLDVAIAAVRLKEGV